MWRTGHVQARHKHHEADNDLYDRIRKESRKRKGSSASGPSSAKKSKPAPKEDNKDLENQLEFNIKKKKWSVQLPWIDPELESHRLTDNLKRVTAMMRKVHDVVLEEDMPMVDQAYIDWLNKVSRKKFPRTNCIRRGGRIICQPDLEFAKVLLLPSVGLSETLRKRIRTTSLAL